MLVIVAVFPPTTVVTCVAPVTYKLTLPAGSATGVGLGDGVGDGLFAMEYDGEAVAERMVVVAPCPGYSFGTLL